MQGDGGPDASTVLRPGHVGLVHDWLPVYAGAERVLEQIIRAYPSSDLYSLIDFIPDDQRDFLQGKSVETSFIQRLPFSKSKYRYYLPLAPMAIEQFDLTDYDVVVSSSYAVAKGILTKADQLHVSYVHSPIRYAWDLHHDYLRESGLTSGIRSMCARAILHYIRLYDAIAANRVDVFLANSQHVARRIWKTYRRKAQVIYPPVDVDRFQLQAKKEDFYLTMSRLVPYKRIDLIVEAFTAMPDKELVVIGDGPEMKKIEKLAGPNVTLLGYQPDEAVEYYMQNARAFVFAAEEDFGIVPVEAQACGTPVIAYGRGGALETIVPGQTGIFFQEQDVAHLKNAIDDFEAVEDRLDPETIRANAERFSPQVFRDAFTRAVNRAYAEFIDDHFVSNDHAMRTVAPEVVGS
ncbi:glycosyl transferase family 1 [Longibacter salinarum]|uniref:Glycosyl transferase family 1 n=1 Tax=Longibacter salinarum TaxID=1850348 RepID=A0A2A8CWB2_9BACT|nr:glycosyl transferase family 1 [Longibacter salinarum]